MIPLWDYFTLKFELQDGQWRTLLQDGWTTLDEMLPFMGKTGWELVSVTPTVNHQRFFVPLLWPSTVTQQMLLIFNRPRASAVAE